MTLLIEWRGQSEERRRLVEEELGRITDTLAGAGARRVWLLGSQARGDATGRSDIDLLVVMPRPPRERIGARAADLLRLLAPRVAVDIVVYTPEEFAALRGKAAIVDAALAEGRLLLERD